jgi:hypothetical protein
LEEEEEEEEEEQEEEKQQEEQQEEEEEEEEEKEDEGRLLCYCTLSWTNLIQSAYLRRIYLRMSRTKQTSGVDKCGKYIPKFGTHTNSESEFCDFA